MISLNQLVGKTFSALILGWGVSIIYVYGYKQIVDFTEKVHVFNLLSYHLLVLSGTFILYALSRFLPAKPIFIFLTNLLLAGSCLVFVFVILNMDDVQFQNEDSQLFADYYKGFLMPLAFIPQLSWFVVQPLFSKIK